MLRYQYQAQEFDCDIKNLVEVNKERISLHMVRSMGLHYLPCSNCSRHPSYPSIPAVTLHQGGRCLMCEFEDRETKLDRAVGDG
jgi:hypothetical protein